MTAAHVLARFAGTLCLVLACLLTPPLSFLNLALFVMMWVAVGQQVVTTWQVWRQS